MANILIFGGDGWIGSKVVSILENENINYIKSNNRADDIESVKNELDNNTSITHIMCFIGRTHGIYEDNKINTIDYLEKPGKLVENIKDNLFAPVSLALLCKDRNIHFTYLGTGCIFTYDTLHNEVDGFKKSLQYYLNLSSLTEENFEKVNNINLKKIYNANTIPSFENLEKIATALNINLKDLIPNKTFISVKINKYKKNLEWKYPSEKNYIYKFVELTNVSQLPCSKALELSVMHEEDHEIFIEVPAHQYLYNIGETDCILEMEKVKQKFSPGDSIYLKPNAKHKFLRKSKILILRIGGKIYGENLYHISSLSDKNFERLINDNKPWFN
jgi:transcriptional regulator with XRE-family HTH domain